VPPCWTRIMRSCHFLSFKENVMKAHSDYMYDDQVWMHLLCSCWFYVPRSVIPQRNTVTFDVPMGFFIPVINLKSEVGHLLHGWTAQSGLKDGRQRNSHPRYRYFRDRMWRHGNDEIAEDCCEPARTSANSEGWP